MEDENKDCIGRNLIESCDIIKRIYVDKLERENWNDIMKVLNEELPIQNGEMDGLWDSRDNLLNDAEKLVSYTQPSYWDIGVFYTNQLLYKNVEISICFRFRSVMDYAKMRLYFLIC